MTQIQPQIMENLNMGSKRKSKKQTSINRKHFDKLYVCLFVCLFVCFFHSSFPSCPDFFYFWNHV